MKKFLLFIVFISCLIPSQLVLATTNFTFDQGKNFEAKVIDIIRQENIVREDGTETLQQNIKLKGLKGDWKNKEIIYYGISEIDVLSNPIYKVGDRVWVNEIINDNGEKDYYILNFSRRGWIYLLGIIFSVLIILIGRKKGFRSLLSLCITFFIITKFIVPQIMTGSNPLFISIIGCALILGFIIYLTEGFTRKSHLAIISILISLFITFVLALIFVKLAHLTGFSSEEASFLVGSMGNNIIDFSGLLLAGILIGTLGVLDDVVLGQIESVNQIKKLNPDLSNFKIFRSASEIGRTHLSSIVNTLFLTYAGASLPLLILFAIGSSYGGVTWIQAIDNEQLATEIIRTLVGSIGLALAFPISTILATYFLKNKK
ncbi:MAG: YibE/F family protein [Patescibacteria group bacterium]|jgi:uncharacterized membrane protein|nr:YibE/F family protein [Candidatus Magasanikbacteria bacterium]